ncbi:hypothetical protein ACHWQZ_G018551 [Mnemiopsis leidyi]
MTRSCFSRKETVPSIPHYASSTCTLICFPRFVPLRLLHMYPNMLPKVQVDKGAIKFVLSGAHIMCPGLTSPGADLPEECLPTDTPVSVHAEGKINALAIGHMKMSSDDIKSINKGVGIDNVHYLNDGLWRIDL